MARKFLTPIDLSGYELRNARSQNLPTGSLPTPGSGNKGLFAFDSTLNKWAYSDGTNWIYPATGADITAASTADRARANHTGTQSASTISDFDAQARTSRLDQMAAPTANVSLNTKRIIGLASPVDPLDAANKLYVDLAMAGTRRLSVGAATTANIALSGGQTIDGVSVGTGTRVLVKNQTSPAQNGLYDAASPGAWTRTLDMDAASDVDGTMVVVEDGTQAGSVWITTSEVATLNTDSITWTKLENAADIVAGAGLAKTGLTLSVPTGGITSGMILEGTIVDADINASAAIAVSKLSDFSGEVDGLARLHYAIQSPAGGNVNISSAPATLDGITPTSGDRIFLIMQTAGSENGLWIWNGAGVAMTRPSDWKTGTTRYKGESIRVGGYFYSLASNIVVGTSAATFTFNKPSVSSGGVVGTLPVASGGTGATSASAARINLGVLSRVSAPSAASTVTTINAAALGAGGIVNNVLAITIWDATNGEFVEASTAYSGGDVTVTFGVAVAAAEYTIHVIGF